MVESRLDHLFASMRALTETETQTLFSKLANYTGRSLTHLIAPPPSCDTTLTSPSDRYVFRLHASRVYYLRLSIANLATSIARPNLLSIGTCLGKFTKTGKFRLHITALDVIAPHARYKVWVKPNGEMPFLYGGNVVKAHVGRWSEDCPEHQGVVVLAMDDTPLVSEDVDVSVQRQIEGSPGNDGLLMWGYRGLGSQRGRRPRREG